MTLKNSEREEFICEHYKNRTMGTREMQKTLKISPNDIYVILRKNGIELRGNRLDKTKSLEVSEMYKSGMSMEEIYEKTGISHGCIAKQLRKHNIKSRTSHRTYALDETIFEKIDSNEKAQFLGLLYADGTVSKVNKLISLRLREDDSEYLNDWREKLLKTDKPLYISRTTKFMTSPMNKKTYKIKLDTAILDITSMKIYADAIALGLAPNKTYKNLPMPNIEEKYKTAFLLGLFEGDGCITACDKSRSLTIACQSNMAKDIQAHFNFLNIFSTIHERKHINIVQVARREDLKKLYAIFYADGPLVVMKRKQEKFKKIIDSF